MTQCSTFNCDINRLDFLYYFKISFFNFVFRVKYVLRKHRFIYSNVFCYLAHHEGLKCEQSQQKSFTYRNLKGAVAKKTKKNNNFVSRNLKLAKVVFRMRKNGYNMAPLNWIFFLVNCHLSQNLSKGENCFKCHVRQASHYSM